MHGGAFRVAMEQFRRLGDCLTDVYSNSDATEQLGAAVHHHPVKLRRLMRSPWGRLNGFVNLANLRSMTESGRQVAREIDAGGFDVVLALNCRVTQTPPILRFLQTPVVYYSQEPFRAMHEEMLIGGLRPSWNDPGRVLYSRAILANEYSGIKRAQVVLANSYYSREYMLSVYGVQARVNYLGIDSNVFSPTGGPRTNRVLSVGRLSTLKGHEFVMDSLARIDADRRPELGIVYGPRDPAEDALRKAAESRGVKVTFWSEISDEELARLYSTSLCTAYAPVLEPFGLVPLESMACCTPAIGVREAGVRETITHGQTGFLSNRDPAEFAGYIERLMSEPGLVDSMGRTGREQVVSLWNWEKSMAELRAVLEEVAGSR